eukprot:m.20265 g.20265  ORF g.20265 m.20265 type:complete len:457 (-) comp11022_c0_seq1:157-1527(-)
MSTKPSTSRWKKGKKPNGDYASSDESNSGSAATSPKTARREVARGKPSPKPSPLLKRFSLFKNKRKPGSSAPERPSSRWRRSHRAAPPPKEHSFQDEVLTLPTWCDHCDDLIWGLFRPCIQCQSCGYTAHAECQPHVTLECSSDNHSVATLLEEPELDTDAPAGTSQQHRHPKASLPDIDIGGHGLLAYLSNSDIQAKVTSFNEKSSSEKMELLDDASGKQFKGYIRVTLNLSRPIRVSSSELGLSLGSASPENTDATFNETPTPSPCGSSRFFRHNSSSGSGPLSPLATDTNFYLPKNISKGLFVTSVTTAQEVISILLRKFKVVSNPRKFALYEMDLDTGGKRRLRQFEEPLALKLLWGGDNTTYILSLEEYNNDMQFKWDDFTEVELENFIRILEQEEAEATSVVTLRYQAEKEELARRIAMLQPPTEGNGAATSAGAPPDDNEACTPNPEPA